MKNKIKKLIKESKADIKEYHLKRIQKDDEYPGSAEIETVGDVMDLISDWEFSPDEDLAYIYGRISALEELL